MFNFCNSIILYSKLKTFHVIICGKHVVSRKQIKLKEKHMLGIWMSFNKTPTAFGYETNISNKVNFKDFRETYLHFTSISKWTNTIGLFPYSFQATKRHILSTLRNGFECSLSNFWSLTNLWYCTTDRSTQTLMVPTFWHIVFKQT